MAIVTKNWISRLKLEMQTSKHVEYIVVVANTGLSCVKAYFQSSHEAARCECMHEHFHPIAMLNSQF
jgi:hypothetical protein